MRRHFEKCLLTIIHPDLKRTNTPTGTPETSSGPTRSLTTNVTAVRRVFRLRPRRATNAANARTKSVTIAHDSSRRRSNPNQTPPLSGASQPSWSRFVSILDKRNYKKKRQRRCFRYFIFLYIYYTQPCTRILRRKRSDLFVKFICYTFVLQYQLHYAHHSRHFWQYLYRCYRRSAFACVHSFFSPKLTWLGQVFCPIATHPLTQLSRTESSAFQQ